MSKKVFEFKPRKISVFKTPLKNYLLAIDVCDGLSFGIKITAGKFECFKRNLKHFKLIKQKEG